ncbi:DEAD/DEAH box helicase [Lachnospiraceae bacterium C1.1]|nr:DEAD/DEAH box helicase [Lachnospiraceae bacterium C1.1]
MEKKSMENMNLLEIVKDWKPIFAENQLRTARNYIEKGNYRKFASNGRVASATIGNFHPRISKTPAKASDEWDIEYFDCDCAIANSKKNWWMATEKRPCPHEAALLFLWERSHGEWRFVETEEERDERIKKEKKKKRKIELLAQKEREEKIEMKCEKFDFGRKRTDEPLYFDIPNIVKSINTDLYAVNRGNEYYDNVSFKGEPDISFGNDGYQQLSVLTHTDDEIEPADTEIIIGRKELIKHNCSCRVRRSAYYYSFFDNKLCGHELASLKKLWDYVNEYNPGDETDNAAESIFRIIDRTNLFDEEDEDSEHVIKKKIITLCPRLVQSGAELYLSFRMGKNNGRMLMLKSYRKLQEAIEGEEVFTLGKSLKCDFSTETFDEKSEKWLGYILGRLGDVDSINKKILANTYGYYGREISIPVNEQLTDKVLDRFFELAEGMDLEIENKNYLISNTIHIGEGKAKIKLLCNEMKTAGKPVGVRITGQMPTILYGQTDKYELTDRRLGKISKEEWDVLNTFKKASDSMGNISFHVGKNRLAEFYYRVVPGLIDNPYIDFEDESGKSIESILPPEPEFSIKLDVEGDFCVADCEVRYGENTHLLMNREDAEKTEYHDFAQEHRVITAVEKYLPIHDKDTNRWKAASDDNNLFRLITQGIRELNKYAEVSGSGEFYRHKVRTTPKISFNISVDSGLLDIEVLSKDLSREELTKIYKSYKQKKRYYKLKDGSFIELDDSISFSSIEQIASGINVPIEELFGRKKQVPMFRALYLDKLLEEHEELVSSRDRTFRSLVKGFRTIRDADYEIPDRMEGILRNYQIYGHKWMRTVTENHFGGILADEMGLGKTLETISVMVAMKGKDDYRSSLVVCPASLVYNWEEEIKRFAPELSVETVAGNPSSRKEVLKKAGEEGCSDVYITSYDLLRADIDKYKKKRFSLMVIDEAQYIKNTKAAMTKAVKIVNAEMRMALTGTPIENRLAELWSIFDFLMPGFLYDYKTFSEDFEAPITRKKDEEITSRLKKMVSPFILRRKKEDVLKDLPAKLEEVRYAKFDKKQREVYDAQVLKMKGLLENEPETGEGKIKILAELTRIRQICCDPSLLFENYKGDSAKREACIELVKNAIGGNHRMLIFSQFTSMLDLLEEDLKAEKIPYFKITGSTGKEKRLKYVHDFNEGDVPVFLISLKAGGTGLNLTGADMVIHYDPWWNLAAQNQATDRAHRIGQTKTVTVYKLIAKGTIEEKIMEMQEAKKDLADAILSGEQKSLMSLSNEELMELLQG